MEWNEALTRLAGTEANLWVTRKLKPFALLPDASSSEGSRWTWNEKSKVIGGDRTTRGPPRQQGETENRDASCWANYVRKMKMISPTLIRKSWATPPLIDRPQPGNTLIPSTCGKHDSVNSFRFPFEVQGLRLVGNRRKCVYGTSMGIERPLNSLLYAWQADCCPTVIYSPRLMMNPSSSS